MIPVDWIGFKGTVKKHLKEIMLYHLFKESKENSCPLHLDKPTFNNLTCYVIMKHEQEGKRYITSYYTIMHDVLVHMYRTVKVEMPKYFRA